jgi:uncharacterized RDD family membrane protein YckC
MAVMVSGGDPTKCVWRRFFAWIADGLINALIIAAMLQLLGIDVARERTTGTLLDFSPEGEPAAYGAFIFAVVLLFVVNVILVGKLGWTLGKLVLGIRVAGWDGKPPGIGKALVRSLVFTLGTGFLGCLYLAFALYTMTQTKGHRQPADFVASTWVIDGWFKNRMLIEGQRGMTAGPPAITRAEAEKYLEQHGASPEVAAAIVAPGPKTTKPFYDKTRDTYVVWNEGRKQWLQFDKAKQDWVAMQ